MARPGLFKHRKFARLASRLRSPILAVGVLETLWYVCGETCDDRVGTAADLAFALKWTDRRVNIACVLHESGFLDCDADGHYVVHDFWDHCPQYVKRRREREDVRHADGTATKAAVAAVRTMASQRLDNGLSVASTPVSVRISAEQGSAERAPARDPDTGYVVGSAVIRPSGRVGGVAGASPSAVFACGAFSVPGFLHAEFRGKLGHAGVVDPDADLRAWYQRVADAQVGRETPADNLKFLRAQFDVWRHPEPVAAVEESTEAWAARMAARTGAARA